MTALWDSREKLAAAAAVALLHVAVIFALLAVAVDKTVAHLGEHETTLVLLPPQAPRKTPPRARRNAGRSTAIAPDYDYRFVETLPQSSLDGLRLALDACRPENWDKLAPIQRQACARIDLALAAEPGGLAPKFDVRDAKHWAREHQIEQTPLLLPCADPNESAFFLVNLKTLSCLADIAVNGYDPDKMQHYAK